MFACSVSYPQDPITLTRFILKEQQEVRAAGGHVTGSFAMLLQSIQLAVKVIANASTKAGIANLYGVAGSENKSGDQQKKLDVFSNDVFINAIKFSQQVAPFTPFPLSTSLHIRSLPSPAGVHHVLGGERGGHRVRQEQWRLRCGL